MLQVEIIGTIDNQRHYDIESIKKLLLLDSEIVMVGRDFVGRPGTRIHASDENVIKIRTELHFNREQSRSWVKKTLKEEQSLGIYHPHKTWLLIADQRTPSEPEKISIASICPRLKPLHIELKQNPTTDSERDYYLKLLSDVFYMYLSVAKQHGYKLDEGLSNFAISDNNIAYYLDDEYYSWDNFNSFGTMLGVYIRNFDWLDEPFIELLGGKLIELINTFFQDNNCCSTIIRQLQSIFMPQGEKEKLLQQLIQVLNLNKIKPYQPNQSLKTHRFFALLADIHANYAALDTVLNYLKAHNIEQGIILGDIVGYNAEPKECIERLQETDLYIIKGNHDHAVATNEMTIGISKTAQTVIEWTIEQLSLEHRAWLKNLPLFIETEDWLAVHGAPMDPAFFNGYVYTMTYEDNLTYMQEKNIGLCFHGHTHLPCIFARDKRGIDICLGNVKTSLSSYLNLLVCPGSVGQPRNGCTDTQFAIYDREQQEVSFLTLPYDNQATIKKMRENNFSEALWQRLLTGK